MKTIKPFVSFIPFLLLAVSTAAPPLAAAPVTNGGRKQVLLDAGWRFQLNAPTVLKNPKPVTGWRWRAARDADSAAQIAAGVGDTAGADWKDAALGQDVFGGKNGFAVYQTILPDLPGPTVRRVVQFASVDDNATVYLNGVKILRHEGWNDPFDAPLPATAWRASGPNTISVVVENTDGGGGVSGATSLGTSDETVAADFFRPDANDKAWRTVHLPHDFVIEGKFQPNGDVGHGALPTSSAWYRKIFTLPASDQGKAVWLDFDGVYRDSIVYLNGKTLGRHACGYTPFRYDISRAVKFGGTNTLAVQVNAQKQEGWWYEGGGIYRHVWLHVADPVHLKPWGTFVTAKLPEPIPGKPVPPATVTIQTDIAAPPTGGQNGAPFTLVSRLIAPNGIVAGTISTALTPQTINKTVRQQVVVAHPALWSIETPSRYRLRSEIRQGSRVVDATETPFGIRTLRFDTEKGFFLNGKSVKIQGTCNHQDFIGVGVAMPDSVLNWRVKKLREMGSNAYRTSHNPPTAELLDACDRQGMLVMDENRHLGDTESGKASRTTPYADLSEVESMVLRDRNHPSVIMWSMCNEEGISGSPHGADIFRAMKAVVDKRDGTRPVTCAMNSGYESRTGITSVTDLQGINYNPGAYDRFHRDFPNIPLYGSETASAVGARGVYDWTKFDRYYGDPTKFFVNAYDVNAPPWAQTAENAWRPIAERAFVAGGFVWTGFDYKGEPTPFGWPDINSNFGILDMCGFPKDSYYYYKSWWQDKPVVHLLTHWNLAGQEGKEIPVWAFANGDRVELFLNGKSVGVKEMPRYGHVEWSVPYAPGTLEARSYRNGKVIATDIVETTGAPAALRLSTDRVKLTPDSEDITMVEVNVVDAKGRVVPTADNEVTFTVEGAAVVRGVGNGDPTSHEPDQARVRHAFKGKCMVLVGATNRPGAVRLTARASGLTSASLALRSAVR